MARLAATTDVIQRLFALSVNLCAFPGCRHGLINKKGKFIAEICHIEGVKGERYNPNQTDEERRSADNLVLFCHKHHVETDNVIEYPAARLKAITTKHEEKYHEKPYHLPAEFEESILEVQ